jgi:recombination protein RecA
MKSTLSKIQNSVLVGTMLGDATIERNGNHCRMKLAHKSTNKDYVFWKYNMFREFCSRGPRFESRRDNRTRKFSHQWKFSTLSLPVFDTYRVYFYESGRKKINKEVLSLFNTPLALAVWYMDDGHKRKDCRGLRLSTQSFTKSENELLIEHLGNIFNVDATLHKVKEGSYCLYIPAVESSHFISLVEKHIVKSMKYKIGVTP